MVGLTSTTGSSSKMRDPEKIDNDEPLAKLSKELIAEAEKNKFLGLQAHVQNGCIISVNAFTGTKEYLFDCTKVERNTIGSAMLPIWNSATIIKLVHDVTTVGRLWNEDWINIAGIIDTQLLGEHLFQEPYLSQSRLAQLLQKHSIGRDSVDDRRSSQGLNFFRLVQEEIGRSLGTNDIQNLVEASRRRLTAKKGNQVCFNTSAGCILSSAFLSQPANAGRDNFLYSSPLLGNNDIGAILDILPDRLREKLDPKWFDSITDIVLDVGRRPHFWADNQRKFFCEDEESFLVAKSDVDGIVVDHLGIIGSDNRASLDQQLHRFSVMRDRRGNITGVTIRIGRHVEGISETILDLIKGTTKSILILGDPGSGKTTFIRDIAKRLAEDRNVVVVDTSNEIGGDGSIPHSCIGHARRMMVPTLDHQCAIMVECVQNHTPHAMVIDEIGRRKEVDAARTVSRRGVRMVASAHGSLRSLVENKELVSLVGGVGQVALGDEMASRESYRRQQQQSSQGRPIFSKMKSQRLETPTFDVIVEIDRREPHSWRIVKDVAKAVDDILDGVPFEAELRTREPLTGEITMSRVFVSDKGLVDRDRKGLHRVLAGTRSQYQTRPGTDPGSGVTDSSVSLNHHAMGDTHAEKVSFQLFSGVSCSFIQDSAALNEVMQTDPVFSDTYTESTFVALDAEGVPDNLHLLQLATQEQVYVIDCLKIGPKYVLKALKPFLRSDRTIKVLHDLKCDAQAFYRHGDVPSLDGVLDTQLVAEHLWEDGGKIGLNVLLERLDLPKHPSKDLAKSFKDGGNKFWSHRPVPIERLEYAACDVTCLFNAIETIREKLGGQKLDDLIALSKDRADEAIGLEKMVQE
eukprot:scaffold1569_cov171-Amphora_coffeaeformis.AAC.3